MSKLGVGSLISKLQAGAAWVWPCCAVFQTNHKSLRMQVQRSKGE